MSFVTLIAVVWLIACLLGLAAWGSSLRDSQRTLEAQRRAGENGVLEAIAREFIVRDAIGAIIASSYVLAAAIVLLTETDAPFRVVFTRMLLTIGMGVFTVMGVHGRVRRRQIADLIRRLYAEAHARKVNP